MEVEAHLARPSQHHCLTLHPNNNTQTPPQTQRPASKSKSPPELCPPHWRIQSKPSLRSTLKAIICKDWAKITPEHPESPARNQTSTPTRPSMRMKESDDYITARAANPRTGLISPSIRTGTPCTLDSPGDALKLRFHRHGSPTPRVAREALSKADEGRKISGASACIGEELEIDAGPDIATPNLSCHHELADVGLKDDQFVVHMPSAREPEVTYPGYSADQIAALEHYKDKTRRVSNEGYDRRLIHTIHSAGEPLGYAERTVHAPVVESGMFVCPITGQHFKPYRHHHEIRASSGPGELVVRKRNTRMDKISKPKSGSVVEGLEAKAASLSAPFSSPKTSTINRRPDEEQEMFRTVPGSCSFTKHAEMCSAKREISGKKIRLAPSRSTVAKTPTMYANNDQLGDKHVKVLRPSMTSEDATLHSTVYDSIDLSSLPRVKLVRPEHAGLPTTHELRRDDNTRRQCSFGCKKVEGNGECIERRNDSTGSVVRRVPLFEEEPSPPEEAVESSPQAASNAEVLIGMICSIFTYIGSIQLPKSGVLETLTSHDAPAKDKIEALKTLFSLAGHALAICTTLAMLWKLGNAVMHLLEVVLWPLAVPIRIMRWLFGVG